MTADNFQPDDSDLQGRASSKRPRILVIRVGAIGDTLMTTPAVRALRRSFPGAYLGFLCSPAAYPVLQHNPYLDHVISMAHWRAPWWLSSTKRRALSEAQRARFESLLVLESDARFVSLARVVGAQRAIAYGALAEAGEFESAPFNPRQHMIENYLQAAAKLGAHPAGTDMDLGYPPALDAGVWEKLSALGVRRGVVLAGIHAAWGGRQHSLNETRLKSWPPERFAEVARSLVERTDATILLTGSADDRPLNDLIARLSSVPCLNLAGRLSLAETAALLRRLDVYVTVDSGPAHMAAALGTPLVTLLGPAIIEQTVPRGTRGPIRVLYHRVQCAPCYGTPLMKSCRDNICMKEIGTAEVMDAVEDVVRDRRAARWMMDAPSGSRGMDGPDER
jgi:lipopolysaccharide heptosyltransferase II